MGAGALSVRMIFFSMHAKVIRVLHLHTIKMKYLLHIDTSTDTGMVAIGGDGQLIAAAFNKEARNHASSVNNMITEVLASANIPINAIDAIVVCAGPGSYTGLRIGLATAKGLCYAMDKPLLLDNRLTLLAHQNYVEQKGTHTNYIPLLIARDKEYFISIYDENFDCILTPRHIAEDELPALVAGMDKVQVITNAINDKLIALNIKNLHVTENIEINLSLWVSYAFEQYKCNNTVNLSTAEPFYLKQVYTHK